MNLYYVIDAAKVDEARKYAPTEGLPNQLFQLSYSPSGAKAVVQAEWLDVAAMDLLGVRIGALLASGQAEASVYAYSASDEWVVAEAEAAVVVVLPKGV